MEISRAKIPKEFDVKIKDKTPQGYPRKYHSLIIAGSSRSGKTTCIVHLLDNIAPAYKNVIVFSPSIEDPTWTSLRKHDNILFSDVVSNHILHTVFERQKKMHSQSKENSLLIVIDDYGILAKQTGLDITKTQKPETETVSTGIKQSLDLLFSRGRHFSTSIIASFHDALQPSPLQRVNATNYIIYRLNEKQYERISPKVKCFLSDKEFITMANDYTKDAYNFLYIDLKAHKNKDVFKHGKPAQLET